MAMLFHFVGHPDSSEPEVIGNSHAGFQALQAQLKEPDQGLVSAMGRLIQDTDRLDVLEQILESKPTRTFAIAVLGTLTDEAAIKSFYTPERTTTHWRILSSSDGSNESGLDRALKLIDLSTLLNFAMSQGFQVEQSGYYAHLIDSGEKDTAFLAWCRDALKNLSTADWTAALEADNGPVQLALSLDARGTTPTLGFPFKDAIGSVARDMIHNDKALPEELITGWSKLLAMLESGYKDLFNKDLADALSAADGKISATFFKVQRQELPSVIEIIQEPVRRLFDPLVRERNDPGLRWISEYLSAGHTMDEFSEQAAKAQMKDRLSTELSSDKPSEATRELARLLQVQEPTETLGEDPDSEDSGSSQAHN